MGLAELKHDYYCSPSVEQSLTRDYDNNHTHVIVADNYMLTLCLRQSYYVCIVLYAQYMLKIMPAQSAQP